MEKVITSFTKVRFQDCDPFNHLNNSKYIDYFINAREDQVLREYNLDIFALAREKGISWVVSSHQIHYLKPAMLMETVCIESQLIGFTAKSLHVEMRMLNESAEILKAVLWTQFIHVDLKTQRPTDHEHTLIRLFESALLSVEQPSLPDRIRFLQGKSKAV